MNCKPGDLARVVNHPLTRLTGVVDRFITVRDLTPAGCWTYEGPRMFCACPCGVEIENVHDSLLRPVRDQPGQDEMLRIAGLPADLKTPEPVSA